MAGRVKLSYAARLHAHASDVALVCVVREIDCS